MNELLTWGLAIFAGLALYALSYSVLQTASSSGDYWMARGWFGFGTLILLSRVLYWGLTANRPEFSRIAVCFVAVLLLTIATIQSLRSISKKQRRWAESGIMVTQQDQTEIIKRLSGFAEEGNQLLIENRQKIDPDWPRAKDWGARSEEYIKQHIAPDAAAYFSMEGAPHPYPGGAVSREYVDWLQTRINRLGEMASEVRQGKVRRANGNSLAAPSHVLPVKSTVARHNIVNAYAPNFLIEAAQDDDGFLIEGHIVPYIQTLKAIYEMVLP